MSVLYPDVAVKLSGVDGNAFVIIGYCTRAMKRAGVPSAKVNQFVSEAMAGDYDHLLRTCMKWVSVS